MDMPGTNPVAPPPVEQELVDQAVAWAREAGDLTLGWFRHPGLAVDAKADGSPVTRADHDAEHLLRERIAAAHPHDAIIGEEHDDVGGTSGRTWVIDPIDGTHAFSHGVGTYSNLLYLEDSHGPAVGVINLPALAETVWAGRGRGCFLNGEPTAVAAPRPGSALEGTVLCTTGFHRWSPAMFDRAQAAGVLVRTWGDAYGYALVASGRAAAMFDPLLAWWDLAAVMVVVQEAGGVITRRDGSAEVLTATNPEPHPYSAIASGGADHELWVAMLADG